MDIIRSWRETKKKEPGSKQRATFPYPSDFKTSSIFSDNLEKSWIQNLNRAALYYILPCFLCSLITAIYLAHEDPVYTYDYCFYYNVWYETILQMQKQGFGAILKQALHSFQYSEYNLSPVLPLLGWGRIFGLTRFSYLTGIICVYFVPALLLIAMMVHDQLKKMFKETSYGQTVIFIGLAPMLWIPLFRGFLDIAVLIPLAICMHLFLTGSFVTERRIGAAALFGLCFFLCFLLRRWMSFALMAFPIAALPLLLIDICTGKVSWKEKAACLMMNGFTAVICMAVPLFLLQGKMVMAVLKRNNTAMLAPWQHGLNILDIASSNTLPLIFLCISALILFPLWKNKFRFPIFCLLFCISYIGLFTRVQSMGMQHRYGYFPAFIGLAACGFFGAASWLSEKQKYWSWLWKLSVGVLLSLVWLYVFTPQFNLFNRYWASRNLPLRHAGYPQIMKFMEKLEIHKDDHPGKIYRSACGGFTFNGTLIKTLHRNKITALNLPQTGPLVLDNSTSVDFIGPHVPFHYFSCDYAIVLVPFERHLDIKYQQILFQFCRELQLKRNVGKAYELEFEVPLLPGNINTVDEFKQSKVRKAFLDRGMFFDKNEQRVVPDNLKIRLYRRTRKPTAAEQLAFAKVLLSRVQSSVKPGILKDVSGLRFQEETKFQHDDIKNFRLAYWINSKTIFLHPWKKPTSAVFDLKGQYKWFDISFQLCNSKGNVIFLIYRDGKLYQKIQSGTTEWHRMRIPLEGIQKMIFQVDCNGNVTYDGTVLMLDHIEMSRNE